MNARMSMAVAIALAGPAYSALAQTNPWVSVVVASGVVTDPNHPIATKLNALPKHVATRTLERLEWNRSTPVREVSREVRDLLARYPGELQTHGSSGLLQTLFAEDLVDELNLLTFTVILGSGKRLFGPGTRPAALVHAGTRTTSTGVIIATYRRGGKPTYGSFLLES